MSLTDSLSLIHIAQIEKALYPIYNLRGEEKTKSISEMMEEYQISGLSIAFLDSGKIAWTKCYGYANIQDSIKMLPSTLLRAASLSKPLTAMAALNLVERGQLDLSQNINEILIGWKLPENHFTLNEKVTVARLIGHTSGIKNDVHRPVSYSESLYTLEQVLKGETQYSQAEVINIPGQKYKYSNLGYMVLSELLQDISNQDFYALMDEMVLGPCKMKNSTFNQELSADFKKRIATGYDENGNALALYKHASAGAGALWSTPSDLAKFLGVVLEAYHNSATNSKLISHKMAKEVFKESKEKLGFNKSFWNGNFVFRNDGSIPGFNCTMMGSVNKNQAVVIMLNTGSDKAYDFLNYLWRSVSMEYNWGLYQPEFYSKKDLSHSEIEKFVGIYSINTDSIEVFIEDEKLMVKSEALGPNPLVAVGSSSFLLIEKPLKFYFEPDSSKNYNKLFIRDEGGNDGAPFLRN